MRSPRIKSDINVSKSTAAFLKLLPPLIFQGTGEELNGPQLIMLSAMYQEITEPGYADYKWHNTNQIETRLLAPSYLLGRYPILSFKTEKRVRQLFNELAEKKLIETDGGYRFWIPPIFRQLLFFKMNDVSLSNSLIIPQYAIVTHEVLWQMNPSHIIIGTAIVRLIQARGPWQLVSVYDVYKLTGFDLSYKQMVRYIQDLILLGVFVHMKVNGEVSKRLWLSIGRTAPWLLPESQQVQKSLAELYRKE